MKETYAALIHTREFETESPRATIIYSTNGILWHEMCFCHPDYAEEVVFALNASQEFKDLLRIGDDLVDSIRSHRLHEANLAAWESFRKAMNEK